MGSDIWANCFGRRLPGSITSITSVIVIGGSALGPVLLGIAGDLLGGCRSPLTVMSIMSITLAVLQSYLPNAPKSHWQPQERERWSSNV